MKTLRTAIILIIATLAFSGCKKEDNDIDTPQTNNQSGNQQTINQDEYVACKVNGVDFLSKDDTRFNHAKKFAVAGHVTYQFRGGNDTTNSILISFFNEFKPGTFEIKSSTNNASCQYLVSNPLTTYDCNQGLAQKGTTSGTVTVTSKTDEWVEGTFEFTAVKTTDHSDKVTVTDGRFKLKFK